MIKDRSELKSDSSDVGTGQITKPPPSSLDSVICGIHDYIDKAKLIAFYQNSCNNVSHILEEFFGQVLLSELKHIAFQILKKQVTPEFSNT